MIIIHRVWEKFSEKSKKSSSFILLHLMYFFGIGLSSIVAKATGRHFLDIKPKKSTWIKPKYSDDPELMF